MSAVLSDGKRIVYGLIITIIIFTLAQFASDTHHLMFALSVIAIYILRENVNYKISLPKVSKLFKPALLGFLLPMLLHIPWTSVTIWLGFEIEKHVVVSGLSLWQVFFSIVIVASVAEEMLFRGFLVNFLKPLQMTGVTIFGRYLSVPVIIGAITFGLVHLVLLMAGQGFVTTLHVVISAILVGLIAGYYQEKYDNNAFAVIVHMSANLPVLLTAAL